MLRNAGSLCLQHAQRRLSLSVQNQWLNLTLSLTLLLFLSPSTFTLSSLPLCSFLFLLFPLPLTLTSFPTAQNCHLIPCSPPMNLKKIQKILLQSTARVWKFIIRHSNLLLWIYFVIPSKSKSCLSCMFCLTRYYSKYSSCTTLDGLFSV